MCHRVPQNKWEPGIFPGRKRGRCLGMTNLPPWNLGASASWNPQGLPRPVQGLLYLLPRVSTGKCQDVRRKHG